jgi:hypothetical protein
MLFMALLPFLSLVCIVVKKRIKACAKLRRRRAEVEKDVKDGNMSGAGQANTRSTHGTAVRQLHEVQPRLHKTKPGNREDTQVLMVEDIEDEQVRHVQRAMQMAAPEPSRERDLDATAAATTDELLPTEGVTTCGSCKIVLIEGVDWVCNQCHSFGLCETCDNSNSYLQKWHQKTDLCLRAKRRNVASKARLLASGARRFQLGGFSAEGDTERVELRHESHDGSLE